MSETADYVLYTCNCGHVDDSIPPAPIELQPIVTEMRPRDITDRTGPAAGLKNTLWGLLVLESLPHSAAHAAESDQGKAAILVERLLSPKLRRPISQFL